LSVYVRKADQYAEHKGKLMKGRLLQMFGKILGTQELPKLIW